MRIVLAHSYDIVTQGLRAELASFSSLKLAKVVHDASGLRGALLDGMDLAVTGLFMPGFHGIASIEELCRDFPGLRIVVLTAYPQYYKQARKLGVSGYVLKSENATRIARAILDVAQGGTYYSPECENAIVSEGQIPRPDVLSEREVQVIRAVAEGKKNAEIARALEITTRTVEFHKQKIKEKLGLETSADLIRYVYENRL